MDVITQKNSIDTEAVVILYGWLGCIPKNLKKYAELYTNHAQHKCAAIYGTVNTAAVIFRHKPSLTASVMDSVRKAASIVREVEASKKMAGDSAHVGEPIPVLLHYFSNGGSFLAIRLKELINDAIAGNIKEEQDSEDLILLNERLKGRGHEVLDSSPAFISEAISYRVLDASVPNLPLRILLKGLLFMSLKFHRLISYLPGRNAENLVFWNDVLESDLCPRQAFVYSTADRLTDSKKLDEYIDERKKRGIDVTAVLKFEDSDHVMHMRKYPKEYQEKIVDHALKASVLHNKKSHSETCE